MHIQRILSYGLAVVFTVFLVACGGGGGSTTNPPPTSLPAPSGLSYSTPQVFTRGQAITNLSPTVTGTVASYAITPALPAGLSLDTTSGVISGTPQQVSAQASYTVTATNSSGATTAAVSITVNDVAATVSYPSTVALATGVPVTAPVKPTSSGGAVISWSINPMLPAGLTFGATDGSISGTPTAASAAATYTVTATNSGGPSTATLTLSVEGPFLDLGHADGIKVLGFDGTHVVSEDTHGHWVLWNYSTGTSVASGDSGCFNTACPTGLGAAVAGPSLVILIPTGFELRSSTDGHLVATIPFSTSSWVMATDGSYFAAAGHAGLSAWNATGTAIVTKSGDYSQAIAFANPANLLVASGAAGASVVETTNIASTASTVGPPFSGTFHNWFSDGGRFITTVGNTALIYSNTSVQQEAIQFTSPGGIGGGFGDTFWNVSGTTLSFYTVGAGTTPTATFPYNNGALVLSGTTLGMTSSHSVSVFDLSGATPVKSDFTLPNYGYAATYAASSAAQWLMGNNLGVVLDGASLPGTPRFLDYGQALSIAGTSTRLAIATASGRILTFDPTSLTQQGTIQQFSSGLHLSTDGTVLAAQSSGRGANDDPDWSLNIYSLPSASLLAHWPYTMPASPPGAVPMEVSLSGTGSVLAQVLGNSRQVSGITPSSNVIWMDSMGETSNNLDCMAVRLSPDGTLIAPATGPGCLSDSGAQILKNGTLVTAVSGWPLGWLDDGHLITNAYTAPDQSGRPNAVYSGALIYDPTGKQVGTSAIPELHAMQPLAADSIYSPEYNSIFTVSTGAATWLSPVAIRGTGAVAGAHVVFASGARVLALSH